MSSLKKPSGNIHKIREFDLEKIHLVDEFDILQIVGEGWFGKILLVEHRASGTEMVLKAVPKPYVSLRDFYREFHFGLHLGIHRNIVTTYDVAFETAGFYVFTQEYATLGDLTSNVTDTGIGEQYSKRVAKQIASALDYMHSKDIVHRDVKLDNVLIFRSDFTRVKLCDFGESYQTGTVVERRNEWLPYSPPEVLQVKAEDTYKAQPSHDVWQFGIVMFVCLTGCLPWQKAAFDDPRYARYVDWQQTLILPLRRTPKLFKLLTSKVSRMFRRFLDPRPERRPKNISDFNKLLTDRWLAKSAEKDMAEYETDELCPSMYSFHSSPDEKNRLLYTLAEHGIETTVDRVSKKNRIRDWIESSVITEEDENEEEVDSGSATPSSSISREPMPGHISSIRAEEAKKNKPTEITTTLKDASKKHFDPRTGALQEGPSAMGATNVGNTSTFSNPTDSLRGSLITLGSRNDLISSNGGNGSYLSLGEPIPAVNVGFANPALGSIPNPNKFFNKNLDLNNDHRKPIAYQRARSDSAKSALGNQKQFLSSSAINYINNSANQSNNNLNNAFQSLTTLNTLSNESSAQAYSKNFVNNSQVKDSGYGSFDGKMDTGSGKILEPADMARRQQSNGQTQGIYLNKNGTTTAAGQNMLLDSRQRHLNSTTKDTAYDRIGVGTSITNARRRK